MPPEENGVGSAPQPQNNPVPSEPQIAPAPLPESQNTPEPAIAAPAPEPETQAETRPEPQASPEPQIAPITSTPLSQNKPGSRKMVGVLITVLFIGVIGVAVAFAAKLITNRGADVDPQALLAPAIEKLIDKEEAGLNTVMSLNITAVSTDEEDSLDIDGNITFINDMYVSNDSFETSGNTIISAGNNSLNISASYLFTDTDAYFKLDSFTLDLNEDTPDEFGILAFMPIGEIEGQWIHIPFDEFIDEAIEIGDVEYESYSDAIAEIRNGVRLASETELWRDIFTNLITYSEDKSTTDAYAYSSNFTTESIIDYLTLLGLDYAIDDMEYEVGTADFQEELQKIVDAMNSTTYFVNKDTQEFVSGVLSGYEIVDEGFKVEIETTMEVTDFKKLTPPSDTTNIDDLFGGMFGPALY
jgi:hypothetical protein